MPAVSINANDIKEKRKVIVLTHLSARNILEGGTDYESLIGQKSKGRVNLSFQDSSESAIPTRIRMTVTSYIPFTTSQTIFGDGRLT